MQHLLFEKQYRLKEESLPPGSYCSLPISPLKTVALIAFKVHTISVQKNLQHMFLTDRFMTISHKTDA